MLTLLDLDERDLDEMNKLVYRFAKNGVDGLAFRAFEMTRTQGQQPNIFTYEHPTVRVKLPPKTYAMYDAGQTDVPITYRNGGFTPKWNEAKTTEYDLDDTVLPAGQYPPVIEPEVNNLVALINSRLASGIPLLEERLKELGRYGAYKTGIVELARATATIKICSKRTMNTRNEHGSIRVRPSMSGSKTLFENKAAFTGSFDGPLSDPYRSSTFSATIDPATRKVNVVWINGPAKNEDVANLVEQLIKDNSTARSVVDCVQVIAEHRRAKIIEKYQSSLPRLQTAVQQLKADIALQHAASEQHDRGAAVSQLTR